MKKLLIALTWYIMVQSSDPCIEPIWYEMEFDDDVTHLWSRSTYHDFYESRERATSKIDSIYNGLSVQEIDYYNVVKTHNISLHESRRKTNTLILAISN